MPLIEEPDHTQKRSKRRKPPTLDALLNDIAAPAPEPELTPERTRAEMYARQQITNQHQTTMRDDVDQNRAADAAEAPTPGGWANPFAPIITTGFQHTSSTAPAIQMHDCVTVAIPMRDVAELLADLAPLIAPATRKTPLPRQAMKLIRAVNDEFVGRLRADAEQVWMKQQVQNTMREELGSEEPDLETYTAARAGFLRGYIEAMSQIGAIE